MFCLIALTLL